MNIFLKSIYNCSCDGVVNLWEGGKLFVKKKGTTLASSSTFYALITVIPFLLLLVRGIGVIIGDLQRIEKYIFLLAGRFFPDVAPELLVTLQNILKGPLFAGAEFTLLNFGLLAVSSISFLNSIWTGIYLITEDESFLSLWRFLKGIAIIGITIVIFTTMLYLPAILIASIKFIQTNIIIYFFYDVFEFLRPAIHKIQSINVDSFSWINSGIFHAVAIMSYFAWLYRWFFSSRISWKEAYVAALTFTCSVFLGKSLFWIYLENVRGGLKSNYGDLYTSVIGVMWVFYLMCFFFYGACICNIYLKRRKERELKAG